MEGEVIYFKDAHQVRFFFDGEWNNGIVCGPIVICACCGAIFHLKDILTSGKQDGEPHPVQVYEDWVDFSESISG